MAMPKAPSMIWKWPNWPLIKSKSFWDTELNLVAFSFFQKVVHQFAGGVVHLNIECLDLRGEVVKHHHCGDGHKQAQGCSHQRLGNTARNCIHAGGLLLLNLGECVDDADHCA